MKQLMGWQIQFHHGKDGFCCRSERVIHIGVDNDNIIRLLLHEIAHIQDQKGGNQHNQKWFNEYKRLHRKFLKETPISKSDKIIQEIHKLK